MFRFPALQLMMTFNLWIEGLNIINPIVKNHFAVIHTIQIQLWNYASFHVTFVHSRLACQ